MTDPRSSAPDAWAALQQSVLDRLDPDPAETSSPNLVFRAEAPIQALGIRPGDLILIDPVDNDHPVAVYRPLPPTAVVDVVARLADLTLLSPITLSARVADRERKTAG